MTFDEKLKQLEEIESKMPKTYSDLLSKIDMYIYGCEQGLDKALELGIIASIECAMAEKEFKVGFAKEFLTARESKMPSTILKDYARSKCIDKYSAITDGEMLRQIAQFHIKKWEEKLQVYKKIKNPRV